MKRPEYFLKVPVSHHPPGAIGGAIEFAQGTVIHPIWNEQYLPSHLKKQLDYLNKPTYGIKLPVFYIMCLVGTCWIPIDERDIGESN